MKKSGKTLRLVLNFAAATTVACGVGLFIGCACGATSGDSAAPSNATAARTQREIITDMMADQKAINELLGKQNAALKTSADREGVAPKLIPLIQRCRGELNELLTAVPQAKEQIAGSQMQLLALLSILGEKDATDQIEAMLASKDVSQSLAGEAHQFMARFFVSDNSDKVQAALVEDLEKLDRAHPDSVLLTQLTIEIGHEEGSADIGNRVIHIASDVMDNHVAGALREQLTAKKEAEAQDALMANKPINLSGTLADGAAFSTDSLKGKVVLVDFWATWCVPCKAELPRVKKMYEQYHSKGFEVVGVSNDYSLDALKAFVATSDMPWPEFFDADTAEKGEFNSITKGQKIDGIPVMYLIDKKGILRTVNARGNMEVMIPQLLAEPN